MEVTPQAPQTPQAPAPQTPAPQAPAPQAPSDWTTGFNDDLKGYVQNKGFKDPSTVVDSYRNLEKLLGAKEKLVRLPDKDDDMEGWNGVYQKLGRPEKPEDYGFKMQDEAFGKWAQGTFHELGLSAKQAEKLVEKWNGFAEGTLKTKTESYQQKLNQEAESLKKEWGAAYDQQIAVAKRAAQGLGVSPEQIDGLEQVMGFAGVMKFMSSLGSKLGEGKFVGSDSGQTGFGTLTPEAAKNRIQTLRQDPGFVDRYIKGDAAAREEMDKLHRWANPE